MDGRITQELEYWTLGGFFGGEWKEYLVLSTFFVITF